MMKICGNVLNKIHLSPNRFVKLYPSWGHRVNIPYSNRTRTWNLECSVPGERIELWTQEPDKV